MAMRHPAHSGAQGLEADEPKRRFHAKFFVEGLLRIANHHEGDILLVRADRLRGGVKDDHLLDARRFDLASTPAHLGNVRVADRTVHEPPELQMDESVRVGKLDRLAVTDSRVVAGTISPGLNFMLSHSLFCYAAISRIISVTACRTWPGSVMVV